MEKTRGRRAFMFGLVATVLAGTSLIAQGQTQDGIAQLNRFVANAERATGTFAQTVHAASGRQPQQASGHFAFERPGKFRWAYEQPYAQLLVSDGTTLWSWDQDLNQVTIKTLGDALGGTPVAVLAGNTALERDFELAEAGSTDGLAWVLATPKNPESTFERMRLGLSGNVLRKMELRDHFGQTTVIDFSEFALGAQQDAAQFRFVPPAGADVIGE